MNDTIKVSENDGDCWCGTGQMIRKKMPGRKKDKKRMLMGDEEEGTEQRVRRRGENTEEEVPREGHVVGEDDSVVSVVEWTMTKFIMAFSWLLIHSLSSPNIVQPIWLGFVALLSFRLFPLLLLRPHFS